MSQDTHPSLVTFRVQLKALVERHRAWRNPPPIEQVADLLEAEARGLRALCPPPAKVEPDRSAKRR